MLSFSYLKGFNKKNFKKKDYEFNVMVNIFVRRFFVENIFLKFRRLSFFIGFVFEVYRVFILLFIFLCFFNMFRIIGL